ncbi:uncharacterized protein LOC116433521 [Nomia melanderi]|uniref:uncharacterized protein LOC116433521 n=1 Tax=Nomia melanderi TaxID=2448451 RepID=UPI003FCE53D9
MEQQITMPLSNTGNQTENWLKWKKGFINYLKVNDFIEKSEDLKIHLLKENIGVIGQTAIDKIYKESNKPINNMNNLLEQLDIYFQVSNNEVIERYKFFSRFQNKDETINAYILDLKKKAETCNFGTLTDSLIRDKVIVGIKDKNLRMKLFNTENLDLIKLMTIYHEHTNAIQTKIKAPKHMNIKKRVQHRQPQKDNGTKNVNVNNKLKTDFKNDVNIGVNLSDKDHQINAVLKRCGNCNMHHLEKCCPAWGHKCMKCGARNHYTDCCRFKKDEKKEIDMKTNILNPSVNPQRMDMKPTFRPMDNRAAYFAPSSSAVSNNFGSQPSAPAFSEIQNELYPNLNHMLQKGNIKSNDTFQRSETLLPPPNPQTSNCTPPLNPQKESKKTTKTKEPNEESCTIS